MPADNRNRCRICSAPDGGIVRRPVGNLTKWVEVSRPTLGSDFYTAATTVYLLDSGECATCARRISLTATDPTAKDASQYLLFQPDDEAK